MKQILFFCSCLLIVLNGYAQTPAYYTNQGTSNNIYPFGSTTSNNKVQWLYLSSDFNVPLPSGQINRVYFRTWNGTYSATYTSLNIRFISTSLTGFPSTTAWVTGAVSAASYTTFSTGSVPAYTWYAVDLQTPYQYTNGDNLIVEIEHNGASGSVTNNCQAGPGGTTRRLWGNYGSTTPSSGATGSYGDIGFDMILCQPPATVTTTNISVQGATHSWTPVSGSLGYEYVLDQNAGSPTGSGTFTSSTSYVSSGLNLNTTYYFHVRNICSNGYSAWQNISFTTLNAYCLPPDNILKTNLTATSVDLVWSKMPTSDWYEYHVDLAPFPPLPSGNTKNTTNFTAHVSGLQPGTQYYIFMRSICLNGADTSYWKKDSLITQFHCDQPQITVNGFGTTTPSATWMPVPTAVAYEYVVTQSPQDPAFGKETQATSLNLNIPADGTDQYLHVRTKCNSQFLFSQWSTAALRATPSGITNVNTGNSVEVYPNPANDHVTVNVKQVQTTDATISVTDITGKTLITLPVSDAKTTVNIQGLVPGIYILKYTDGVFTSQKAISKR
jgi:hypothetical protein